MHQNRQARGYQGIAPDPQAERGPKQAHRSHQKCHRLVHHRPLTVGWFPTREATPLQAVRAKVVDTPDRASYRNQF